ncbi:hypothetical protein DUI87_03130 [Hirundo rustica rustica]|uniref:ribonuclease H n=1 Tax=Hirundo rustica rustica TaxID=333673 RepID=A0A3M0L1Z0_HIRRU|nr:hypothetical protein DUI87_03130 [Hirundo rustica rustica]
MEETEAQELLVPKEVPISQGFVDYFALGGGEGTMYGGETMMQTSETGSDTGSTVTLQASVAGQAAGPTQVVQQGYKNSPTIFGEQIAKDLESWEPPPGEGQLLQYVDDLLIATQTQETCMDWTVSLLNFLGLQGYRVSQKKAQMVRQTVIYLGYQLPEKVAIMHIKAHQKVSSELEEGNMPADREAKEAAKSEVPNKAVEAALIPNGKVSIEGKPVYNKKDKKLIKVCTECHKNQTKITPPVPKKAVITKMPAIPEVEEQITPVVTKIRPYAIKKTGVQKLIVNPKWSLK